MKANAKSSKIFRFSANERNSDMKISSQDFSINTSKIRNLVLRNNRSVFQFDYDESIVVIFEDETGRTQVQVYPKTDFWADPDFFITEKSKVIDDLTDYLVSIAKVSTEFITNRVYHTTNEIKIMNLR